VFILRIALAENEGIGEKDNLPIDIFNKDEESLSLTVNLLIPLKVQNN
jgi:hypothetical protein